MDKQHASEVIDGDCRRAPLLGLLGPHVFSLAGNHANTLDQCFVFFPPGFEILALAVDDFYQRNVGAVPVKGQNRHIFGQSWIVDVAFGAHQ